VGTSPVAGPGPGFDPGQAALAVAGHGAVCLAGLTPPAPAPCGGPRRGRGCLFSLQSRWRCLPNPKPLPLSTGFDAQLLHSDLASIHFQTSTLGLGVAVGFGGGTWRAAGVGATDTESAAEGGGTATRGLGSGRAAAALREATSAQSLASSNSCFELGPSSTAKLAFCCLVAALPRSTASDFSSALRMSVT